MKRLTLVILPTILILVLLSVGCSPGFEQAGSEQPATVAPDFQLPNLDGQVVALSDLRGKPVLINFWATWCPACVEEMPYLQETYEKWTGKGLVLLTIDIGETSDTVKEFMQKYNLTMPVLLDTSQSVAQRYNITAIPTTFLIDKDGIIRVRKIGAFPSAAAIEKELSKIMP